MGFDRAPPLDTNPDHFLLEPVFCNPDAVAVRVILTANVEQVRIRYDVTLRARR